MSNQKTVADKTRIHSLDFTTAGTLANHADVDDSQEIVEIRVTAADTVTVTDLKTGDSLTIAAGDTKILNGQNIAEDYTFTSVSNITFELLYFN